MCNATSLWVSFLNNYLRTAWSLGPPGSLLKLRSNTEAGGERWGVEPHKSRAPPSRLPSCAGLALVASAWRPCSRPNLPRSGRSSLLPSSQTPSKFNHHRTLFLLGIITLSFPMTSSQPLSKRLTGLLPPLLSSPGRSDTPR